MRILVSNDDGIYSPGLLALAEAAARFGDVKIVAPDVEQSSMAHAVTATRPLRIKKARIIGRDRDGRKVELDAHKVNGTPADCVCMGAHVWGGVDVVFSGINLGLNVGNSMWHSGTLAAAKQAALLGFRGIAFSSPADGDDVDYASIRPCLDQVIEELLACRDLPLLNVNVPLVPKGIRWTRQSVRHYDGRLHPTTDPMGREHFWFSPVPIEPAEPATDRWAIEHDLVSITPLRLDLTDLGALERMRKDQAAE